MDKVDSLEPEPCRRSGQVFIGTDSHGHWVVRDALGRFGGLFINRKEALRYALFENGHQPSAVMMVPGVLELFQSKTPDSLPRAEAAAHADLRRAA